MNHTTLPYAVQINGKTVAGFVDKDDAAFFAYTKSTENPKSTITFVENLFGYNFYSFNREKYEAEMNKKKQK